MATEYRILRNEPRCGIGNWTGDLVANETLTIGVRNFTEDIATSLVEAGLIERADADPLSDPPSVSQFLARAHTQTDEEIEPDQYSPEYNNDIVGGGEYFEGEGNLNDTVGGTLEDPEGMFDKTPLSGVQPGVQKPANG